MLNADWLSPVYFFALPGYVLSAPAGSSWNDIGAKGAWDNSMWTVEFSRKLDTGHTDDAQFKDLKGTYIFNDYLKKQQFSIWQQRRLRAQPP